MSASAAMLIERVGIALLHSLWQGSLVGIVLLVALLALRQSSAQVRYVVCCVAMITMLLLPIGTFLIVNTERPQPGRTDEAKQSKLVTTAATALEVAAAFLPQELPRQAEDDAPAPLVSGNTLIASSGSNQRWLSPQAEALLMFMVGAWGVGVVLLSCRVLGGYVVAWRLTRRLVEPLEVEWQSRFRQLASRIGVRGPVELWQSACVEAPVVIGCFRPVVLVPVGLLTGLSVPQIEAIFAHELAHVRRYDFLVNAVQCVIETLLFYHPCAWWISARIRAEREHCCDDMAVAVCGNALVYARALAGLEELRPRPQLVLALTGGGSLLSRVRRIVGQRRASDVVGGWFAGSLAIVLPLAVGATWVSGQAVHQNATAGIADLRESFNSAGGDDLAASGPNAPEDTLFRDAVKLANDLTATLAKVTDAPSATAAAEEIVGLSRRHAEVDRRLRELRRSLRPETESQLAVRWEGRFEQASAQLRAQVARVEKLPGAVDALRSSVLFEVIGLHGNQGSGAASAPLVDFLVRPWPNDRMPGPGGDPLERMLKEHGQQRMVKVVVLGLPGDVYGYVYDRLRQILPNIGYVGSGAGDTATVYLAPISDIESFAAQIDLGEVSSIDQAKRVITVMADPSRLPAPKSRLPSENSGDAEANQKPTDIASLGERLIHGDHSAVGDLVAWGSDAEPLAVECAAHADRAVRRDALLVLKKIGGAGSLPAAIRALADTDLGNRDLAWQIVCRLPGATKRLEVIAAAAKGLERDGEQAAKWLSAIGPAAEAAVVPFAQHESTAVRRRAIAVLSEIGGPDSLSPLEALFDDPDASIAAAARAAYDRISARQ